ncbi:MAG: glycosyltransferase [Deltaproteobacteria bacterium]|nr:glycosyltransferase [Deltaproteobacteria bacterium]
MAGEPSISILIPTRDRAPLLPRALASVVAAVSEVSVATEIVVIDNGSSDGTAALLSEWVTRGSNRVRLFIAEPGRSRALNRGLQVQRAPLVLFTDDDVDVGRGWVGAVLDFFDRHPDHAAAVGRVCPIPADDSESNRALMARFPGLHPFYDAGEVERDVVEMYGCNMAVRRTVFDSLGGYDERLGVGASGLCEDTDLSRRMRQAGMRIGYMPDAVVYHGVDRNRLTPEAFRQFQVRAARSHFLMDPQQRPARHRLRLFNAVVSYALWSLRGSVTRRAKAWGRILRHREMLRLCRAAR